jgi:phosphoribosylanthranilate isomerase
VVRVKICGNTRPEDVAFEVKVGVHAVGVIHGFPESPRNNDFERTKKLVSAVPPLAEAVVVTDEGRIESAYKLGVTTVQLIARPDAYSRIAECHPNLKIIPVMYVGKEFPPAHVIRAYSDFGCVLVDTESKLKGGSGVTHNWEVSKLLSKCFEKIILAGGLNPDNVGDAISVVEPYAVDVSSGVESSPGVKDHDLILRFVEAVKQFG